MATAEIKTKLTADGSELFRTLDQSMTKAGSFKSQVGQIGQAIGAAFTVHSIARVGTALVNLADDIDDTSQALFLSTNELQTFDAEARKTKGGVEAFRDAIGKLVRVQADAIRGDEKAVGLMEKIGIGTRARTTSTADLLKAVADYYAKTQDLATLEDLLGRNVLSVKDAMDGIAASSIPELIAKQKSLGQVIDADGIQKLAKLKEKFEEMKVAAAAWLVDWMAEKDEAGKPGFKKDAKQAFKDTFRHIGAVAGALAGGVTDPQELDRIVEETTFGTGESGKLKSNYAEAIREQLRSEEKAEHDAKVAERMAEQRAAEVEADRAKAETTKEAQASARDILEFLSQAAEAEKDLREWSASATEEQAELDKKAKREAPFAWVGSFIDYDKIAEALRLTKDELGGGVSSEYLTGMETQVKTIAEKIVEGTAAFKEYGEKVLQGLGRF